MKLARHHFINLPFLGLFVFSLLGLSGPENAQGQVWRQTVVVQTPIRDTYVTAAFRDSLVARLEVSDVKVRRAEDDPAEYTYNELMDVLDREEGMDVYNSANTIMFSYTFENDQQGFRTSIDKIAFLYRPETADDVDVPLMYVDAHIPMIQNMLLNSGTEITGNEAVFQPFLGQLTLHRLPEATIIKSGNNTMRTEAQAEVEKRRVLERIRGFLYN